MRDLLFANRNAKRIVNNNYKLVTPINTHEIISTVKYAIKNNYKITTNRWGHSYYLMRHFTKLNEDKLIIIDTSNMKKIKYLKNILNIEAGVTSGDIRKFNMKLRNKWCLHGKCDKVGLGFWINGGQVSGIDTYSGFKNGLYGCDMIRKINYIDYNGNFKSITKESGKIFNIIKKMGGEFGVIVSIDVELINEPTPISKQYAIYVNKANIKDIYKQLFKKKELNGTGISTLLFLYRKIIIICSTYNPQIFKGNIKFIIENVFNKNISKVFTFISSKLLYPDWSKSYKLLFNNNFNQVDYCINEQNNSKIINNLINICLSNNNMVLCLGSNIKLSKSLKLSNKSEYEYMGISIFFKQKKYEIFDLIEKYLKDSSVVIRYFNTPGLNIPIKEYFSEYSEITYEEMVSAKKQYDPNKIFINRWNLDN